MVRILFVCLANVCRSPMAEAIFKDIIRQNGLDKQVECDSAGTFDEEHSDFPLAQVNKVLMKHGIQSHHKARKLNPSDYQIYDYILAMDSLNLADVQELMPKNLETKPVMRLVRDFDKHKDSNDVEDPYYGQEDDFEATYEILYKSLTAFMAYLIPQHGLVPSQRIKEKEKIHTTEENTWKVSSLKHFN
jgi:protein-tyrosine phosphatase